MSKELDELAFSFFKIFAQYEFALKAMKYASAGSRGQVELDWNRFSNEIGHRILDEQEESIRNAVNYLFDNPPKKQILKEGVLTWKSVNTNRRSAQELFAHIRRVRNNLYHGGKFNGQWFEPQRSMELISNSIIVLRALKYKDESLTEAINGNSDK
ncbi:TPA: hypothetical protein QHO11_003147 [Klebsiella oxytoca]|nr:hypothetical protein [Klebsiella oxytoca]